MDEQSEEAAPKHVLLQQQQLAVRKQVGWKENGGKLSYGKRKRLLVFLDDKAAHDDMKEVWMIIFSLNIKKISFNPLVATERVPLIFPKLSHRIKWTLLFCSSVGAQTCKKDGEKSFADMLLNMWDFHKSHFMCCQPDPCPAAEAIWGFPCKCNAKNKSARQSTPGLVTGRFLCLSSLVL